VVITDNAPSGITFNAVTGPNCQLVNNQVTCNVGTLAAGASATVLVQATANATTPLTNTAFVTATNDAAPANNSAAITVMPQSPPSLNPCATVPPTGGPALVINEILYRQAANGDEWVELYATTPIAGGAQFYITDNESTTSQYRFLLTVPTGGIGAGTYIVIHSITGIDDTSLTDGDGLEYFGAGGGDPPYLNNTGDNITVYAGASTGGTVLDYVAYGSGAAVNGPSTGWSAPNVSTGAVIGQSITAIRSGADTNTGAQWSTSGANGTLGPATLGTNNNGKIACNVAIHKTGPSTGQIGAPFDYTLRISNTTGVTLTGVVVTDTQPVGVAFNSVTGAGCHLAGGGFTCTIGMLPPFANGIITVNATANVAQTITNTAFTRAISDSLSFDNRAAHPIVFAAPGAIGDFVYLDANGNSVQDPDETTPLNNVPVTLTLPDGSITTTLTVDGVYAFPNLPPGVYTVTVGSAPGYLLTSAPSVVVTLSAGEIYTMADFGFVYQTADVSVVKQGVSSLTVGENFPYTIEVTNQSATAPALDVVVSDVQPAGIIFIAVGDGRCALFAGQVTCNLGDLPPLGTETVLITATADAAGVWVNTAEITATNASNSIDLRASFTTTVSTALQNADLRLSKTANRTLAAPGETITYTLTLRNDGPDPATGVVIHDSLPAGVLYSSHAPGAAAVYSNGALAWTVTGLAANSATTLTITVIVE